MTCMYVIHVCTWLILHGKKKGQGREDRERKVERERERKQT